MTPRPFGCDGNDCDYETSGWFHVDCALASGRGASEIKHPSMLPTRRHLAANPLPQQERRPA
ncbi:hypothetical protein ACGFZR_24600 [Streptomyces sp. NPDC048241]|uniref:hypothetical protein n=1 Tax=Streptomyces sp. NPDC048241 TaxID=3365521 RepID=UPI0037140132